MSIQKIIHTYNFFIALIKLFIYYLIYYINISLAIILYTLTHT